MSSRRQFLSKLNLFSGLNKTEIEPSSEFTDFAISRRTLLAGSSAIAISIAAGCAPITSRQKPQLSSKSTSSEEPLYTPELEKRRLIEKSGTMKIYYEGYDTGKLNGVPNLSGRIKGICKGIADVEQTFDTKLVKNVVIKDLGKYNGNAMVIGDEIIISLFELTIRSQEDIEELVEHEALHILARKAGFYESDKIMEIYTTIKNERYKIKDTAAYISFLNESNFVNANGVGHADSNILEFTTSFLHSLMHIERLEDNLNKTIKAHIFYEAKYGVGNSLKNIDLITYQKLLFLDYYIIVIEAMINELGNFKYNRLKQFLIEKLGYIKRVKQKIEAMDNPVLVSL